MKKIWILLVVLIIAIIVGVFLFKPKTQKSDKPVVTIGVGLPLTGDSEEYGNIAKQAILLFESDLKNMDNLKYQYKFVIEDEDIMQIRKIMSATNKLITYDKVDAIISYWNNPGILVSEILKDKDILHVSFGNDEKILISEYDFTFYPYPPKQIEMLLSRIKSLGHKKVAVLGCNNAWSEMVRNQIRKQSADFKLDIVSEQVINIGERDFKTVFDKTQAKNPDIYILMLETPEFEIARKKMLEMGINVPMTATDMPGYTAEKDLFEGVWFVDMVDGDKTFEERFKELSKMSNHFGAANIYDIAFLIVQSYEKSDDKKDVAKTLSEIKEFSGKSGKVKQQKRFFVIPSEYKKIKNGKVISDK